MSKRCLNIRKATYEKYEATASPGPIYKVPESFNHSPIRAASPKYSFRGGRPRSATPSAARAAPPPDAYDLGSSLGRQSASNRPSSASYTFGGVRDRSLVRRTAAPGPGTHDLPSTFSASRRPFSANNAKRGTPSYTFGALTPRSGRGAPAAARLAKGSGSPAPGSYETQSSMLDQPLSVNRSASRYRFGTASRPSLAGPASRAVAPGPERYNLSGAFGSQSLSRKQSSPSFSFGGGGQRSRVAPATAGVAPGAYDLPGAVGQSPNRRNAPAWRFGSSTRAPMRTSAAPPKFYDAERAFGPQSMSSRRSSPSFGFGSSARQGMHRRQASSETFASTSSVGMQSMSRKRSAPSFTFGAR